MNKKESMLGEICKEYLPCHGLFSLLEKNFSLVFCGSVLIVIPDKCTLTLSLGFIGITNI